MGLLQLDDPLDLKKNMPHADVHIQAATPVLTVALVLVALFSIACIYGGIRLMSAEGGETTFKFTTKQAGVACVAFGAAAIILTFREVLLAIVDLGRI